MFQIEGRVDGDLSRSSWRSKEELTMIFLCLKSVNSCERSKEEQMLKCFYVPSVLF